MARQSNWVSREGWIVTWPNDHIPGNFHLDQEMWFHQLLVKLVFILLRTLPSKTRHKTTTGMVAADWFSYEDAISTQRTEQTGENHRRHEAVPEIVRGYVRGYLQIQIFCGIIEGGACWAMINTLQMKSGSHRTSPVDSSASSHVVFSKDEDRVLLNSRFQRIGVTSETNNCVYIDL